MEHDDTSVSNQFIECSSDELVGGAVEQRNWRGIAIALLVILVVCALIVTAVIIATPKTEKKYYGERLTLNDFLNKSLRPKTPAVTWISGERFLYRDENGALFVFNCTANTSRLLLDSTISRQLDTELYTISADEEYVLLKYDVKQVFRHSTLASYTAVFLSTGQKYKVKGWDNTRQLQLAVWSTSGNAMVLVQGNNIFYKSHISSSHLINITENGKADEIYNGVTDWLYEEEIFGSSTALWWSPGGRHLLYASFNDSLVHSYSFPSYEHIQNAYTEIKHIKYPKPGYSNPTVKLKVFTLTDRTTSDLIAPPTFHGKDYYVTTVVWKDESSVLVTWMNRAQNFSLITLCSIDNGICSTSIEQQGNEGWVSQHELPIISTDGSSYFWVFPQRHFGYGFFSNVARVTIKDNGELDIMTFLTENQWDANEVLAYDDEGHLVYFSGSGGDPRTRHLFSVHEETKAQICLTCDLDEARCQWVDVSFSQSAGFCLLKCLGPGVPYYSIWSIHEMAEICRLENNTAFGVWLASKAIPVTKYIQVELENEQKEKAWGKLLLPRILNEEEILLYPLLVSVYGGPGTQLVTKQFSFKWETYLASARGMVVLYVDGRGSGGRGDDWLHRIYHRLGSVEVDDTITATSVVSNYHYIDSSKVAVFGWSYGGYLAASVLGRKPDLYRCGISIAPVSDWTYYDSDMKPLNNANVSQHASNLKLSRFMLVHGTADDNVHFQHSAQLMKAMIESDVSFRTLIYPDKHHGLLGEKTRRHLYNNLDDFLAECMQGSSSKFGFVLDNAEEK